MNTLRDLHELIDGLQGAELLAASGMLQVIAANRDEKAIRIRDCLETILSMDEIDQLVFASVTRTYLDMGIAKANIDPEAWFDNPLRHIYWPKKHAEGLYVEYQHYVRGALRGTNEFVTAVDFADMAESLELSRKHGSLVSQFLYQWVASVQPESFAAEYYREHATRTGMLSFDRNAWDCMIRHPSEIVFHRSVLDDYVDRECSEGDQSRNIINPILSLATDNWELAYSQLSAAQQRKLK